MIYIDTYSYTPLSSILNTLIYSDTCAGLFTVLFILHCFLIFFSYFILKYLFNQLNSKIKYFESVGSFKVLLALTDGTPLLETFQNCRNLFFFLCLVNFQASSDALC